MKIEKQNLKDGSCNFCSRGIISHTGMSLVYPYKTVTVVSSSGCGVSVRFCDDCLENLKGAGLE